MKKKIILPVMVGLLMVLATVGVTYAFFNYTRTGSANTVRTGTINFTSNQTRINLSNVFPIATSAVSTDTDNVGTATITVTGDTTYDKGIEYLISATNVTNTIGTKNIPISISATTSGTLGTSDEDYFDNRETATNHIYKVLAKDTISNDDQLMVGYIAKGATGINGTITIKAYIDKDKILISDTYPEGEVVIDGVTYYNGTPTTNKIVFTTTEWNSLNTNGISFQVKVEAREGTWVIDKDRNDMIKFNNGGSSNLIGITSQQRQNITEINFIRMSEEEINNHANLMDFTALDGNGLVKAWIENNKLYVASPGTIYFPLDCSGLFSNFINVISVNFSNINTNNSVDMSGMFNNCNKLINLKLDGFNTSNVTSMGGMFSGCNSLINLDLSNFNLINLHEHSDIFNGCTKLQTLDLSGVTTFNYEAALSSFFSGAISLETIYVSENFDASNQYSGMPIFTGCTSLKGGGTPQTTYDSNHVDKEYARIDGGANSSTPGYLTLKTN